MPIQILMPALSPTMEEGKLARWLVKEGDAVKSGKVIAEIETDKATMEVEAVDEGTVGKILVAEGTEHVRVNQPIAVLLGEGESAGDIKPGTAPASPAPAPAAAAPAQAAPQAASSPAPQQGTAPKVNGHAGRAFASPLARRLAKARGIDIAQVQGSGPHGRVVKRDVESAPTGGQLMRSPEQAMPVPQQTPLVAMPDDKILAMYEKGSYDLVPHDSMRRTIATRLTLAKQVVPHFYLNVDCRLDELLRARERMNATSPKDGPRAFKLSVNDFVVKALGLALQQIPAANVTYTEQGLLRHKYSDIAVAVAIDGGLFTPVIRHVELKSLSEISNEMKDLAERARKKRLAPHEYQGGSTAISNLGMYGISSFDAVINPPHASILAVGAGEKRAVVAGDKVEVATVMSCTLSCDHRAMDGALGAQLLTAFKTLIEDPVRMLI